MSCRFGRVAAAVDDRAVLVERGLLGEVVVAVELLEVARDHHALRVLPGTVADAVARVDRGSPSVACVLR